MLIAMRVMLMGVTFRLLLCKAQVSCQQQTEISTRSARHCNFYCIQTDERAAQPLDIAAPAMHGCSDG